MGADAGMAFISRHVCLAYCILCSHSKVLFFVIIHIICIYIYIGYIYTVYIYIYIYIYSCLDLYLCIRAGRYISKNEYLCIFWLICGMRYISRFLYLD